MQSIDYPSVTGNKDSDTLTLKTDCLSMRNNRYFIRIDQVKSVTYEKSISEEVAQLIMKAIDYTKKRYGETTYIFVKKMIQQDLINIA